MSGRETLPTGFGLPQPGSPPGPPTMYAAERRRLIAEQVARDGRVEGAALAARFAVTMETVRKDLTELERRGHVRRVHGGAVAPHALDGDGPGAAGAEPSLAERTAHTAEKRAIARAALAELPPAGGSIFIESGSTTALLAEMLPGGRELTVVTNTPAAAVTLAGRTELTVLLTGGRVRARTLTAVDDWALRALAETRVDVAFLGTNGVGLDGALWTPDPAEAAVKRAALAVGARSVLLADGSKVGRASLVRYGTLADVSMLVTDVSVAEGVAAELGGGGGAVEVRRVSAEG